MNLILLIVLVFCYLEVAVYSVNGFYSGALGTVLIIVLILALLGRV